MRQRRNTLRIFYLFVLLATGTFIVAVKMNQAAQEALFALGIVLCWRSNLSFLRFLNVADNLSTRCAFALWLWSHCFLVVTGNIQFEVSIGGWLLWRKSRGSYLLSVA